MQCYSFLIFLLVGKTELAKQVARYLHKDNKKVQLGTPPYFSLLSTSNACIFSLICGMIMSLCCFVFLQGFIRLDMSEYQEKHEVRVQKVFRTETF